MQNAQNKHLTTTDKHTVITLSQDKTYRP